MEENIGLRFIEEIQNQRNRVQSTGNDEGESIHTTPSIDPRIRSQGIEIRKLKQELGYTKGQYAILEAQSRGKNPRIQGPYDEYWKVPKYFAWEFKELSLLERFVLAIIHFMNKQNDTPVYMSNKRFAREVGVTTRAIQLTMIKLEQKGYITVENRNSRSREITSNVDLMLNKKGVVRTTYNNE